MTTYTSGMLYYLGHLAHKTKTKVTAEVWQRLKDFDIRRPPRGTRAGRNYIRPIQTLTTTNRPYVSKLSLGANHNNNIVIKPTRLLSSPDKSIPFQLKACCINVQSARNKTTSICEFIMDNDLDIIALVETWLQPDRDQTLCDFLVPTGYNILTAPRPNNRSGGGLALIHRNNISVKSRQLDYRNFESMECIIHSASPPLLLLVMYRPPPSRANRLKVSEFFDEWSLALSSINLISSKVILMGDMNFHVDCSSDTAAHKFLSTIQDINLKQFVNEPTHKSGHTLDILAADEDNNLVRDVRVLDPCLCDENGQSAGDHLAIHFTICEPKPPPMKQTVSYRKLKTLNIPAFQHEVGTQLADLTPNEDPAVLDEQYTDAVTRALDKCSPLLTRTITLRPHAPWYNEELREEKQKRRKLERQWLANKLVIHRQMYRQQCHLVNNMVINLKKEYYTAKLKECPNQSVTYKVAKSLLNKDRACTISSCQFPEQRAQDFVEFYRDKIINIRNSLQTDLIPHEPLYQDEDRQEVELSEFIPTTIEEIKKIITTSPNKFCSLDPIPTWLLKECVDILAPHICQMVNCSLAKHSVPPVQKHAIVTPLLKKPSLDANVLKNHRPVSNLRFTSKVMEKVIASRLKSHLVENNLFDDMQSAYRSQHSTETALLRVQEDILSAVDRGQAVAHVLLDLSAAFDTLDHDIMIGRLRKMFGIRGSALAWIESYLRGRTQAVVVDGHTSGSEPLHFGVPQGSVLGPLLFICYTAPLSKIISHHKLTSHYYADDSQIYCAFGYKSQLEITELQQNLIECLENISCWMSVNKLKLNEDKTVLMVYNSRQRICSTLESFSQLTVAGHTIPASSSTKNLGVTFDQTLSFDKHVNEVVRSVNFHLRTLSRMRKYLTTDAVKTIVQAVIISRLDYCNSLLNGCPDKLVQRLQRVQNSAARLVSRCPRRNHITPVLMSLHWLPVAARIKYKVALITFKILNNAAPVYLRDLLTPYSPSRSLRSQAQNLLVVPKTNLHLYGDRSFRKQSALIWNTLPSELRHEMSISVFKKKLKTHLFSNSY